jgi:hypothetical protein
MSQDLVFRRGSAMSATRFYQLSAPQSCEGCLHSSFREADAVGYAAKAGRKGAPTGTLGLTVEVQINQEGGRLPVMADQVGQEDIDHVIINRNSATKSGHDD